MFVFAALGEFVVVKVLDKQYQMNKSKQQEAMPRIIPVVRNFLTLLLFKFIAIKFTTTPRQAVFFINIM